MNNELSNKIVFLSLAIYFYKIVCVNNELSNKIVFLSLAIYFILANSADADEMLRSVVFLLGLHSLQRYLFRGFPAYKELMNVTLKMISYLHS